MTPEHERFAELATRSLESSPELREEAHAEVLGRLAHGGGAGEIPEAVVRLESKRPRSPWTLACFGVAALVVLGLCAGWLGRQAVAEGRVLQGVIHFGSSLEPDDDLLRESLDPATRDFVFAGIGSDLEAAKNLERQWELHPDELGIYEELIHRRLAANQGLPPDFAETWRRLEPDNGLWPFLEAIGKHEEWRKAPPAGETFSRETLDLLRQSAAAQRFEPHLRELRSRRLAMLGPTETLAEETRLFLYSISALWVPTTRQQHGTILTLTKAAQQAAAEKNAEELTAQIASWEGLVGRLGANGTTLLDLIIPAISWNDTGKAMLQGSRDLGLHEQEVRLDDLQKQLADYQAAYRHSTRNARPMSSLARVMAVGGPKLGLADDETLFEPGRRVEYAVVDRMLGLAAAIVVLLFFAGAAIESFRRGRRINGLADGLAPLFRPADLLWTFGLGIALPALWYVGIARWTPIGLRDIGMTEYHPRPILIQAGAALVFAMLMVVQTARWRLVARAGFLALRPARPWIGWTMAGVAAAVIPAAGGVRWLSGNEERYLWAVAATGGLSLLWLLWEAGSVVFSSRDQSLGGVLLCRRLIAPFTMLAVLLLASWAPLRSTERHWHARDKVTRADRERGGLTLRESRMVDHIRERFHKAFPETSGTR
ncbi:hypothetical protein OKA05_07635 [Luteolibacter arcticus]|uniref:Uncharacterized protein n=1 Tax=Luteolibacter arcticus TaxID=1581411 RepID=A0ABT3GFL9_9BACT|nr:hypothetical protein [Luteolibacter arcticus]MCW1922421.1 hypothetical protein [Luteolibacter arcticus]